MDVPSQVGFLTVSLSGLLPTTDSSDSGSQPDAAQILGRVTLTPSVSEVWAYTSATLLVLTPILCQLTTAGLVAADGTPVRVIAPNQAELSNQSWTWTLEADPAATQSWTPFRTSVTGFAGDTVQVGDPGLSDLALPVTTRPVILLSTQDVSLLPPQAIAGDLWFATDTNELGVVGDTDHPGQIVSYRWTGTPNASTSQMLVDGTVVATQQLKNPVPVLDGWLNRSGNANTTVTIVDGGFRIDCTTTQTGSGEDHNISVSPEVGVGYHFHAEVAAAGSTYAPNRGIWSPWVIVSGSKIVTGAVFDLDFTDNADSSVDMRISFKCGMSAGDYAVFKHVGIYTSDDWAAMQTQGVTYFSGDTAPTI